jgi:hypothetical protein
MGEPRISGPKVDDGPDRIPSFRHLTPRECDDVSGRVVLAPVEVERIVYQRGCVLFDGRHVGILSGSSGG